MKTTQSPLQLLLIICAIPVWIVLLIFAVVAVPTYLLYRAFVRSVCPGCWLPFARRVLASRFDRPNVKFNADHYAVECQCRWCGHLWKHDKLVNTTPKTSPGVTASDVER